MTVSIEVKAQLLAKHYPTKRPTLGQVTFTHADSPILKEGELVTFDAGKFVTQTLWQFAGEDRPAGSMVLGKDSIQLIRDKCAWLPKALEKRTSIMAARKATKRKREEEASTSTAVDDDDDDDNADEA